MDTQNLTGLVKQHARHCGFNAVGIAPPILEKAESAHLASWLAQGYNGGMAYLARDPADRYDACSLLPECRSVVVTALTYHYPSQADRASKPPKVARYAQGEDYHEIVRDKLELLASRLQKEIAPGMTWKACIDTSPLSEKAFAIAAGIGWRGKHSVILNRELGSWFVLGMLLVSFELKSDSPVDSFCGDCTRCLDACPTAALVEPYSLDARRCISYQTTASKTSPVAEQLDGWLYGCDACQQACPFNQNALSSSESRFTTLSAIAGLTWDRLATATKESWRENHAGTEIGRRRLDLLKAAIPGASSKRTL